MKVKLLTLGSPETFEKFCRLLLAAEFSRFQPFSAPDRGLDGYDSDSNTIFQFYFPEGHPRRDKILKDLKKIEPRTCANWNLLLPKDPTPHLIEWIHKTQKGLTFKIEVWGETRLLQLLLKHKDVQEQFFPTELHRELKRLAKGKKPKSGDADSGAEVRPELAAELRQLMGSIAEENASRRKRRAQGADYSREYAEFNAHFELSSYERLPMGRFIEARRYLEQKRYARRQGESASRERRRCVAGIKAIQKELRIKDQEYRRILLEIGGGASTSDLDLASLRKVFHHFRHRQGLAIAAAGESV